MSWRVSILCVGALWIIPSSVHARDLSILAGIGASSHNEVQKLNSESFIPKVVGTSPGGGTNGSGRNGSLPGAAAARALEIIKGSSAVLGSLGPPAFDRCSNLYATVCGGQSPKDEETTVGPKIQGFMKSFAKANHIGFSKLSGLFSNGVRHSQNPAFKDLYGKYFDHFDASTPPLGGMFAQAKSQLARAIAKMPVSQSAREGMEAKLTQIASTSRPNLNNPVEVEEFGTLCGPDGMEPTAYARPTEKDIMICPGLVLRALALGGTAELEHYLLHAIGHECTHHFGADIYKNAAGKTIGESPFRGEFINTLTCYANTSPGINAAAMGGEIAADIGSVKAMADRLRGSSPEDAIKFLRASMGPICGTKADGVHPSDRFRINVLLGQDPDMAQVLHCQVPASSCALPHLAEGSL